MEDRDTDYKRAPDEREHDPDYESYLKAMKKLKVVSIVSIFFITCQCIGGYLANSIAIYTDSAHLASDMIGFGMSMIALKMSMRPASKELTFGWHRAEIIGTMISVIFLFTLTIWLVFEAMKRMVDEQEVKGFEMLVTAVMGLIFNLIQMSILHQGDGHYHLGGEGCGHSHSHNHDHHHAHSKTHDHSDHSHGETNGEVQPNGCADHDHKHEHKHDDHHSHGQKVGKAKRNINVDAAFLHALGDMVMSIGVVIAAVIIYFYPEAKIADPICTFIFSIIVCITIYPIVKNCIVVLMEGSPPEIDTE